MLKRIAVYAVLIFLPAFAFAADPGKPAIRIAIEKFIDAQDISGAVTVVATKDKFLSLDTIGLADIAQKKPMKPDTLFWVASMTKPLTAVSILMLQDEGKQRRRQQISPILPTSRLRLLSKSLTRRQRSLCHSQVRGNRRVPHVRPCVRGPKTTGRSPFIAL